MTVQTQGRYIFEQDSLLEKAYDLLCLHFGSKEIFRRSTPGSTDEALMILQIRFFERKVSRLLIEIAASIRVLSDQVKNMPVNDSYKLHFDQRMNEVKNLDYALFDDLNLDLRETCNKIIHSDILEFHMVEGGEAHEQDIAFQQGMSERGIIWKHYRDYLRLAGKKGKTQWFVLLNIEVFVQGVVTLLT